MKGPSVALVGAGPGDADLLTLRAEDLLRAAALVVVDDSVAALASRSAPGAEVVPVPGGAAIGVLLAVLDRSTGPVVRLYHGDPWLHPAYEPERAALGRAGIATEAVAGVSVELGVPALAGIPVHVRHLAVACTLGPFGSLPPALSLPRTLVATGGEPAEMVEGMAGHGDSRLRAALIPRSDPRAAWRGTLAGAAEPATAVAGPAVLVVGAVCGALSSPVVSGQVG